MRDGDSSIESTDSKDERFKIAFWMAKYEAFLFKTAPYSTYERYTRALDKLFSHFPQKRFLHEIRRADLEDFKQRRLKDGGSGKTINIELSCIRSFFDFLLKMEADGVFLNVARGVRVKMPSKKRKVIEDAERSTQASQADLHRSQPRHSGLIVVYMKEARPTSPEEAPLQTFPNNFQKSLYMFTRQ